MPQSDLLHLTILLKLTKKVTGLEMHNALKKVVPQAGDRIELHPNGPSSVVLGIVSRSSQVWDIAIVAGQSLQEVDNTFSTSQMFIQPYQSYQEVALTNYRFS